MTAKGCVQHSELRLMGLLPDTPLLRCLKFYVAEAIVEAFGVILGMHLAKVHLQPCRILMGVVSLPLLIVCLKLLWAAALVRCMGASSHCLDMYKDRNIWTYSVPVFISLSSFLTVWHSIVCLMMTSFYESSIQAIAARFLVYNSALFAGLNFSIWLHLMWNHLGTGVEAEELDCAKRCKIERLCKMYQSNAIGFEPFSDACCKECVKETEACSVCLENFHDSEKVARLPCGHVFHPRCINKWILEDWRCPYRCPLEEEVRLETGP